MDIHLFLCTCICKLLYYGVFFFYADLFEPIRWPRDEPRARLMGLVPKDEPVMDEKMFWFVMIVRRVMRALFQ